MSVLCVLMPVVMIITHSPVAFFHFQSKHTHTHTPTQKLWTGRIPHEQYTHKARCVPQSFASWKFHNEFQAILRMKMIKTCVCVTGVCDSFTLRGRIDVRDRGNGNRTWFITAFAQLMPQIVSNRSIIDLFDFILRNWISLFVGIRLYVCISCDVIKFSDGSNLRFIVFVCLRQFRLSLCSVYFSLQLYYFTQRSRLFIICSTMRYVFACIRFSLLIKLKAQPQLQDTFALCRYSNKLLWNLMFAWAKL